MKVNTHLGQWLSYVSMQSRKIGDYGVDVLIDMQVLSYYSIKVYDSMQFICSCFRFR